MEAHAVADDGCRLWFAASGAGEAIVLCHGGPGLWDMFGDVADLLHDTARLIRWDQRGCGRSQRCGPYTIDRFVADLEAVRRHVELDAITLLGHSWGAMLALRYALAHPQRVRRLIYVSGVGIDPESTWKPACQRNLRIGLGARLPRWDELRNRARNPDEEREFAVLQWSADFTDPARAMRHAARMATPWFGINYECHASLNAELRESLLAADLPGRCRALPAPVLIVDGERDIRPRRAVDSLQRVLPHVARVTIPGAGHMPWVEDPGRFKAAVTDFRTTERIGA